MDMISQLHAIVFAGISARPISSLDGLAPGTMVPQVDSDIVIDRFVSFNAFNRGSLDLLRFVLAIAAFMSSPG
jgi:hypothetical protein